MALWPQNRLQLQPRAWAQLPLISRVKLGKHGLYKGPAIVLQSQQTRKLLNLTVWPRALVGSGYCCNCSAYARSLGRKDGLTGHGRQRQEGMEGGTSTKPRLPCGGGGGLLRVATGPGSGSRSPSGVSGEWALLGSTGRLHSLRPPVVFLSNIVKQLTIKELVHENLTRKTL